ncbi:MAG: STAS domain-containing protein [Leptospirales bacterium]|nr:STAS domain-containing protein [Leptospirales bacterium]
MRTAFLSVGPVSDLEFADLSLRIDGERLEGKPLEIWRFRGKISNNNSFELNRKMHSLLGGDCVHVIMDLSELEYMNSTGVAILFSVFFRLKEMGGKMVIGGTHPFLRRVFGLMDLPPGMVMLDSVEAAKRVLF